MGADGTLGVALLVFLIILSIIMFCILCCVMYYFYRRHKKQKDQYEKTPVTDLETTHYSDRISDRKASRASSDKDELGTTSSFGMPIYPGPRPTASRDAQPAIPENDTESGPAESGPAAVPSSSQGTAYEGQYRFLQEELEDEEGQLSPDSDSAEGRATQYSNRWEDMRASQVYLT